MKKFIIVLFIVFAILCGCTKNESEKSYKMIDESELTKLLNDNNRAYLVDVRTTEEYNESHIENALNLSVDKIESSFENEITNDKEAIIIVYCRSGARSKSAAETLAKLGYKNVYDFGSITNWTNELVK